MDKRASYLLLALAFTAGLLTAACSRATQSEACPCQGEVHNAEVGVGDRAPDFRLRDQTGRTIALSDYLGERNVVLAFLPGAFTPV